MNDGLRPSEFGLTVSDEEIADYMSQMGFELKNPRNWTYATPDIYLSDMHDENVIRSKKSKKHNVPVTLCSRHVSFIRKERFSSEIFGYSE